MAQSFQLPSRPFWLFRAVASLLAGCTLAAALPAFAAPGGMPSPSHQSSGGGNAGRAPSRGDSPAAAARPGMAQQAPGGLAAPSSGNGGARAGGGQNVYGRGGNGYGHSGYGHSGYGYGRYGNGYSGSGYSVRHLPGQSQVVVRNGSRYWYSHGSYYSYYGGSYWIVGAPIGVVVDVLPAYATFVSFGAGGYYYANNVYYQPLASGGYQVVEPPSESMADASAAPAESAKVFAYPRQGQSAETQESDEYECHRWAVEQSGYDPTLGASGRNASTVTQRADYNRAYAACLDGRGYTVR